MIYKPLGMSFSELQSLLPDNKLPKNLVQRSVQLILISLAFLHENDVIHTGRSYIHERRKEENLTQSLDISSNNILQGIGDGSILFQIEEDEIKRPIARKVLANRHIYYSRPMPLSTGLPVLSDLGEARIGSIKHRGDIMPGIYRAPEVILDMDWDCKVDIWSIGMMVSSALRLRRLYPLLSAGFRNCSLRFKLIALGVAYGRGWSPIFRKEKPYPRR